MPLFNTPSSSLAEKMVGFQRWSCGRQQNNYVQNHPWQQQEQLDHGLEAQARPDSESWQLTLTWYVAHWIHYCPHEINMLLHSGQLFTCYVVDMFASADQQHLAWIERNQPIFRAARFNNLEDAAVHNGDNLDLNDLVNISFSHLHILEVLATCLKPFKTQWL